MPDNVLRIEIILAKDLYTFFCDYAAHGEGQQISPISRLRALSQSTNPCADADDIGLLVAYVGKQCVGYQGVLPGRLRTRDGKSKVYWGTASYVLPEFRKRLVAFHLIRRLIALKKDVIVTYFNKELADFFLGLHFREIPPLEHLNLRIENLNVAAYPFRRFYRLQKRWPGLRKGAEAAIKVTRRVFYPLARAAFYKRLERLSQQGLKNIHWREVEPGKLPRMEDLCTLAAEGSFERDTELVNWMVQYPWIQARAEATKPAYFFGESYDEFQYFSVVVEGKEHTPNEFVVLSYASDKGKSKLKVLDFCSLQKSYENLFWIICKYAARHRVDELELPWQMEKLVSLLPMASLVVHREKRRYLCYPAAKDSPLSTMLPELELQLTDGDSPFT